MTNKAEYPKVPSELIEQFWADEADPTKTRQQNIEQLAARAIEWALQGAEPVAWMNPDSGACISDYEKLTGEDSAFSVALFSAADLPAPELPREALLSAANALREIAELPWTDDTCVVSLRRHACEIEALLESKGCAGGDV